MTDKTEAERVLRQQRDVQTRRLTEARAENARLTEALAAAESELEDERERCARHLRDASEACGAAESAERDRDAAHALLRRCYKFVCTGKRKAELYEALHEYGGGSLWRDLSSQPAAPEDAETAAHTDVDPVQLLKEDSLEAWSQVERLDTEAAQLRARVRELTEALAAAESQRDDLQAHDARAILELESAERDRDAANRLLERIDHEGPELLPHLEYALQTHLSSQPAQAPTSTLGHPGADEVFARLRQARQPAAPSPTTAGVALTALRERVARVLEHADRYHEVDARWLEDVLRGR